MRTSNTRTTINNSPTQHASRTKQLEENVARMSLRDQHDYQYVSNKEGAHRGKTRAFLEDQIKDADNDNLAKFVDYRVENQVEDQMIDYKTEIRRELAEHREDNYMQIEHHFKEFHHKRWVTDKHFYHPYPYNNQELFTDPKNAFDSSIVKPHRSPNPRGSVRGQKKISFEPERKEINIAEVQQQGVNAPPAKAQMVQ